MAKIETSFMTKTQENRTMWAKHTPSLLVDKYARVSFARQRIVILSFITN